MAELSQKDQLALHEFSVQYRKAYAQKHPLSDLHLETIQDAIRSDYEREQIATQLPSIEPSSPSVEPAIPTPEREQEEPEP